MYPWCIYSWCMYAWNCCKFAFVTIYAFVRNLFVKLLSRNVFDKYHVCINASWSWFVFLFEWERFRECCKQPFGERFSDFWSGRRSSTNIYFKIWGQIYIWQDFNKYIFVNLRNSEVKERNQMWISINTQNLFFSIFSLISNQCK